MSYTLSCTADLSSDSTGATVYAQLYDSAGATYGDPLTTPVELLTGIFQCFVTIPDSFAGSLVFYESTDTDNRAAVSINPQETENSDSKVSEVLSDLMSYAVETGHDLETVLQAAYAALRGKMVGNDPVNPTVIDYYAPDDTTVRFRHNITETGRTVE